MQDFFGKKHQIGVLIGTMLLALGFFLLGLGPADNKIALNVAPFILVLAFVVVIPLSILVKDEEGKK